MQLKRTTATMLKNAPVAYTIAALYGDYWYLLSPAEMQLVGRAYAVVFAGQKGAMTAHQYVSLLMQVEAIWKRLASAAPALLAKEAANLHSSKGLFHSLLISYFVRRTNRLLKEWEEEGAKARAPNKEYLDALYLEGMRCFLRSRDLLVKPCHTLTMELQHQLNKRGHHVII